MYIKKSIAVVSALVVLAVGYVAGTFIGLPNVDNTMLKGDIGKANTFNQADSEDVQAALEQLANDKDLQKQTAAAAALLDARIGQMQELADWDWEDEPWEPDSIYPDIIWEQFDLSAVDKRVKNTREAYDEYLKSLAAVIKGEKTEGFEQKANNALLAYTVAERNVKAAAPEVASMLLKVAAQTKSQKAADKAAQWIQYASEDAFLSGSQSEMAYWQSKAETIANSPVLGKMIKAGSLNCQNLAMFSNSVAPKLAKSKEALAAVTASDLETVLSNAAKKNIANRVDLVGLAIPAPFQFNSPKL